MTGSCTQSTDPRVNWSRWTLRAGKTPIDISDIPAHLNTIQCWGHHAIHDVLQYHNVSTWQVPRQPLPGLKQHRLDACRELLCRFEEDDDSFLSNIATGVESWVHHHVSETKRTRKEWRHPLSSNPKKFYRSHLKGSLCWLSFGIFFFKSTSCQWKYCHPCHKYRSQESF